ncbi:hypothetical protein [Nitrosomonas halophila]|jgi:hypothetical protein|uniref:Uncharacterized protein n=1 Tax=Nitrosomonas halophila TaxID=44576 RepID=A0A1H3EZN0_9PROT|nr:hypothetical protein [Nitrosomonas halophila]SDX84060.1 hypothetical protein SAMN05421881_10109 [Nitrosomonas halophila]
MSNLSFAKLDVLKAKLGASRPLNIEVANNLHDNLVLNGRTTATPLKGTH